MIKDRCTLLTDFWDQSFYFFQTPTQIDIATIHTKWNEEKENYFTNLIDQWSTILDWNAATLEQSSKTLLANTTLKAGDILLPLRIMLVGGKFGPGVFNIAALIGQSESVQRINKILTSI